MDEKDRLYKRITSELSEDLVLQRMRLHGFWPAGVPIPPDPPEEREERARIAAEAKQFEQSRDTAADPEKALAEEHKRRIEESRKRRAEQKMKRAAEHEARLKAWTRIKEGSIVHAGLGVSAGLGIAGSSDVDALNRRGLPLLHSPQDVAQDMGISISRLRWLTYHRGAATLVHYHRYGIPKKTGGIRSISAPKPELDAAQRWVFGRILSRLSFEAPAHGFVVHRSILTNAAPHVGRAVVVNLDLKDFFPTITFGRVKGLFQGLGYNEPVATVLALLTTEPPRVLAQVVGRLFAVALADRSLPQGACTSPAITNWICRRLDRRLKGLAARHGFAFTRYADDFTFSGDKDAAVGRLLKSVRGIIGDEGFREHPTKTRVMRRGGRQEVTGVVVNDKPGVSRDEVRGLRAILRNASREGLASQNRESRPDFAAWLRGRVAHLTMVDPSKKASFEAALAQALGRN